MGILKKTSPWEREFQRTWQQEQKFLRKYAERKENVLEKRLDTFTPGPLLATARQLSEAVLFGKLLQNVPVAGAVGGAEDALILGRVRKYAAIKYRKRFLIRRKLTGK